MPALKKMNEDHAVVRSSQMPHAELPSPSLNNKRAVILTGFGIVICAVVFAIVFRAMPAQLNPFQDTPEAVVKRYLNANSWEDRLALVRNKDANRALMQERYKSVQFPTPYLRIESPKNAAPLAAGEFAAVRVVFDEGQNAFGATVQEDAWYILEKTRNGYLIDWQSSIAYNPVTFKAFKAQMPRTATTFRAIVQLSDYYNYEFADARQSHYSIRISENDTTEDLHGYIAKGSTEGQKLFDLLKDGERHYLMLEVQYTPYARDSSIVAINKIVSTSWIEK